MTDVLLTRNNDVAELHRILGGGGDSVANLSAETLELMGKQAAAMFLESGTPLNEGVAKIASQHDDISHEQVKRVVEHANTSVYLAYHDKDKTAGAGSSYPQYDLADPKVVLVKMSRAASPVTPRVDPAYSRRPSYTKVSSSQASQILEEAFGYSKDREPNFTKQAAINEVLETKDSLKSLRSSLEFSGEKVDLLHKTAEAEYYDTVKRHMLDGGSFTDVMAAARSSRLETTKVAEIMRPVVERLLIEKVAKPETLKMQAQQLEKVAHRVINDEHPLVTGFGAVAHLSNEVTKVATALQEVDEELGKVTKFISGGFR